MSDNTIYKNNISVLEKRFPQIADRLNNYDESDRKLVIKKGNACDREILTIEKEGYAYHMESLYDNSLYIDQIFMDITDDWELNGKLFFFGIGNGMYAREFLRRFSDDHGIVIYEPNYDIFSYVVREHDFTDILSNERVDFYIDFEGNINGYKDHIESYLNYTDIYSFKYRIYLNYESLYVREINNWISYLNDGLNTINSEYYLYERRGEIFINNNFNNYKYLATSKSLVDLSDIVPEDVPAIIVSAGPSLAGNIRELKKAVGKAVIIAVDASVNPVFKADIVPDMMVSIDAIKGEKYLADDRADMVPLVCDLNTASGYMTKHKGYKFFDYCTNMYVNEFLSDKNKEMIILPAGGSVANTAFSLARIMGSRTIILMGQDLAFTGKKTHAEGSVRGNEGAQFISSEVKNLCMTEDINGNPIETCFEYNQFRMWFESQIRLFPDMRVIDATEGGARIYGSEIMTLSKAIDETCKRDFNFAKAIEHVSDFLNENEKKEYASYILNQDSRLRENRKRIKEAHKIYDKMRDLTVKGKSNSSQMKSLSRTVNDMLNTIQDDTAMGQIKDIERKAIDEILGRVYKRENNLDREIRAICDIGDEYLNVLECGIDRFYEIRADYDNEIDILKEMSE